MDIISEEQNLGELSNAKRAELALEAEKQAKEDNLVKRNLQVLYGFQPAAKYYGGFTRVSNSLLEQWYNFKSVDLRTGKPLVGSDGKPLYVKPSVEGDAETGMEPKSLEPLELYIFLQLLKHYLRDTNRLYVSISKQEVADQIGKSYGAVRNSFKKLEDLGYLIKRPERKGVTGGSVRVYDITPFLSELAKHSHNRAIRRYRADKDQFNQESIIVVHEKEKDDEM